MRVRLVPVAWLLVLGITGSVTLSLLPGQEIKPPGATGPGVAPGPKPLTVSLPPDPSTSFERSPDGSCGDSPEIPIDRFPEDLRQGAFLHNRS